MKQDYSAEIPTFDSLHSGAKEALLNEAVAANELSLEIAQEIAVAKDLMIQNVTVQTPTIFAKSADQINWITTSNVLSKEQENLVGQKLVGDAKRADLERALGTANVESNDALAVIAQKIANESDFDELFEFLKRCSNLHMGHIRLLINECALKAKDAAQRFHLALFCAERKSAALNFVVNSMIRNNDNSEFFRNLLEKIPAEKTASSSAPQILAVLELCKGDNRQISSALRTIKELEDASLMDLAIHRLLDTAKSDHRILQKAKAVLLPQSHIFHGAVELLNTYLALLPEINTQLKDFEQAYRNVVGEYGKNK